MEAEELRKDCCDPFEQLHLDVFELILQHLKIEEILQSSLVSNLWFNVTEASAKCGEKIHITISPCKPKQKEYQGEILKVSDIRSRRKYQRISLFKIDSCIPAVINLLTGKRWKYVECCLTYFEEQSEFYEMIKTFEAHVEHLDLLETVVRYEDKRETFIFPKLRKFLSDGTLVEEISGACKSLKVMAIRTINRSHTEMQEGIAKILVHNDKLEELTLLGCNAGIIFQQDTLKNLGFKLKSLVLINCVSFEPGVDLCAFNFLEKQASSLEKLQLNEMCSVELLKLIFMMPKLKELKLRCFFDTDIDWENVRLNVNRSIVKADGKFPLVQNSMFNVFFDALPNITFLKLLIVNNDILTSFGTRCTKLEELEIVEFTCTADINPLFLPNIKRVNIKRVLSPELLQRISLKPAEVRTKFEQLLCANAN